MYRDGSATKYFTREVAAEPLARMAPVSSWSRGTKRARSRLWPGFAHSVYFADLTSSHP